MTRLNARPEGSGAPTPPLKTSKNQQRRMIRADSARANDARSAREEERHSSYDKKQNDAPPEVGDRLATHGAAGKQPAAELTLVGCQEASPELFRLEVTSW